MSQQNAAVPGRPVQQNGIVRTRDLQILGAHDINLGIGQPQAIDHSAVEVLIGEEAQHRP